MINMKQNLLLSLAVAAIFFLGLMIIFGDKGLADLNYRKKTRDSLVERNTRIREENVSLSRSIDRLKNDPEFIEYVARTELGMVREDERIYVGY